MIVFDYCRCKTQVLTSDVATQVSSGFFNSEVFNLDLGFGWVLDFKVEALTGILNNKNFYKT